MPRNRKPRPKSRRNPYLCAICGHLVIRAERDHPFRRVNDPDFTIITCIRCHLEVTRWDSSIDKHLNCDDEPIAPFLYILHRIQLTFMMRGVESTARDLRYLENRILRQAGYYTGINYGHLRRSKNQVSENDSLVLMCDIASWAKRAAKLTLDRLPASERLRFTPDYETLASVVGNISADPRQFYATLTEYLTSPNGLLVSEQASSAIKLIRGNGSIADIHNLWLETADVMERATVRVRQ